MVQVNYSLKLELLEYISGYEHEAVDLGDTMIAIDDNFDTLSRFKLESLQ
ncbi:hypothetical protein PO124_31625 [Bacillus licheniformis]|nr:hypothetical protein [Bacillus licheniformis]